MRVPLPCLTNAALAPPVMPPANVVLELSPAVKVVLPEPRARAALVFVEAIEPSVCEKPLRLSVGVPPPLLNVTAAVPAI